MLPRTIAFRALDGSELRATRFSTAMPIQGPPKMRRKAISAGEASAGTAPTPNWRGTNIIPKPTSAMYAAAIDSTTLSCMQCLLRALAELADCGPRTVVPRIRLLASRDATRLSPPRLMQRYHLLIVVFRLRVGGKVCGRITRVPPGLRRSQCSAEGSDEWLDDETVPTNENSAGDPRELQQRGAESAVEAANVDTSRHPRRLSILRPNVEAIPVLLPPCFDLRCPR